MTYPETLQYLALLVNLEKIPSYPYKESIKLERMAAFLGAIGDPQSQLACVHVAGTKGKGSTCAFIAYILRAAGYRVGLYTSPHLIDFRERIRILSPGGGASSGDEFEGMVSPDALADVVTGLRPAIDAYSGSCQYGPLTFFEVYTAAAFEYFSRSSVDVAVLETGLGGRLDATNTVCPCVSVITPVSFDHMDKLGNTLAEIAAEKAGIIKACGAGREARHPIVVSAVQEEAAAAVIRRAVSDAGGRLFEAGKDIVYAACGESFSVRGIRTQYRDLRTRLTGEHQVMNAAVAVGAVEAMAGCGFNAGADAIRRGIAETVWPGRCDVIGRNPLVILDGAHNIASCRALKNALREQFDYRRLIVVLGISQDKDIAGICAEISSEADVIIATRADNPRACAPQEIAAGCKGRNVIMTESVVQARDRAYGMAGEDDAVLVCGSLFVVGEFKYGSR